MRSSNLFIQAITLLLAVTIFILDLLVPLGIASGVPYTIVLLSSIWWANRRQTLALAALCSVLNVGGAAIAPGNEGLSGAITDRILSLLAIWITAIILLQYRGIEEKFNIAEQATLNSMVVVGTDGRIKLVNRATQQLFGYAPHELIGQLVNILVPERFRSRHTGHVEAYIAAPLARPMGSGLELYARRKDGSEFPVEIGLNPIKAGNSTAVLSVIADLTERKRLEKELRSRNEELTTLNQELESFSYSVSHDLRAPLRAINGYSHILLEEYADALAPEARRYLQQVSRNAAQMGLLIDHLLEFSRLGRRSFQMQTVAPGEIVQQVLSDLHADLQDEEVDLTVGWLPPCQADPLLLKQVFTNLLSNAIKYSHQRSPAVIEVGSQEAENPQQWVYFVKDNGVGFDMQHANQLFGVFQRLHNNPEYPGVGIGLAIVHRIVTRHGGKVWAEGASEEGATFYFTMPRAEPDSLKQF